MNRLKASFNDFLNVINVYRQFDGNRAAENIFDILSEDENIKKMIRFSNYENNTPALCACLPEIEEHSDNELFNMETNDTVKQAIGAMVAVILRPFGYFPQEEISIPKEYLSDVFSNASYYRYVIDNMWVVDKA